MATDNNGKIANNNNSSSNNIIGVWAISNNNEKCNGVNLHDCCVKRDIACDNTLYP